MSDASGTACLRDMALVDTGEDYEWICRLCRESVAAWVKYAVEDENGDVSGVSLSSVFEQCPPRSGGCSSRRLASTAAG